jgi:hypothetical protein
MRMDKPLTLTLAIAAGWFTSIPSKARPIESGAIRAGFSDRPIMF